MIAIILNAPGGVENLVKAELPLPGILENEVLVRVKAIGINPIDIKTRKGMGMYSALKNEDPLILGWDISGIVTDTGKSAVRFRPGDEVFGMVNFPGHGKAYAGYVAVPESHLALKPSNITHAEAAAASLAALTAWQVIKYKSGIRQGSRVLIHSAAGGVGHFAVQMARHLGGWVAGTASAKNREFVLSLGADQFIDYENAAFEYHLHDIDFVLDTIGNEYTDRSLSVLRKGGKIICIPSGTSPDISEKAAVLGFSGDHFRVRSDGNDMGEIAGLLEKGRIRAEVSGSYSMDQVQKAHLQIETGKTRGKIVMTC